MGTLLSPHTYTLHPSVQKDNSRFLLLQRASSLRRQSSTAATVPRGAFMGYAGTPRAYREKLSLCGPLCRRQVSSKEGTIRSLQALAVMGVSHSVWLCAAEAAPGELVRNSRTQTPHQRISVVALGTEGARPPSREPVGASIPATVENETSRSEDFLCPA